MESVLPHPPSTHARSSAARVLRFARAETRFCWKMTYLSRCKPVPLPSHPDGLAGTSQNWFALRNGLEFPAAAIVHGFVCKECLILVVDSVECEEQRKSDENRPGAGMLIWSAIANLIHVLRKKWVDILRLWTRPEEGRGGGKKHHRQTFTL